MATIRKKGDLQWHVQIRRKGYPTQTRTFETRRDAESWARDIERAMDRGVHLDTREADKNTLGAVLKRYLTEVTPGHKGSDIESVRINVLLEDPLAGYKMTALSAAAISEWMRRRLAEVTPGTVRRELDIISSAINKARRAWGIALPENPVALVERPRPGKARERRLRDDEEARLLRALEDHADDSPDAKGGYRVGARNPYVKPLIQLAIATAMRRGELLSLTWGNVDIDARVARLPDTKNGDARDVPLSSAAVEILAGLARARATENDENDVVGSDADRVFPVTADAVKKVYQRALKRARTDYENECKTAGTEPDERLTNLRLHDLRHEATSRIATKLNNILELSAVTGHRDVRMLKRYYHPDPSEIAKKLG